MDDPAIELDEKKSVLGSHDGNNSDARLKCK